MPSIPVSESGTVLYYEDTGAPGSNTDYTTLVVIHGSIFHSGVFKRLIPYAAQYNLRLVLLNMRDYPGSTPYPSDELDMLLSGDVTAQRAFVQEMGREIAAFIEGYIKQQHIPPRRVDTDGQAKGGLALLAWSLGNSVPVSLLANGDSLQDETKQLLTKYLRTIVLYDPSVPCLGLKPAEGVYHPMRDTTLSPKERGDIFLPWVSSYFPPVESLSDVTPALLGVRTPVSDDIHPSTVKQMSSDELASCTHFAALPSNFALRQVDPSIYAQNLRRAVADTGGLWSDVKILVVWCAMSIVDSVWGAKGVLDLAEGGRENECISRPVDFIRVEQANHFVHWDEPQKFMDALSGTI